MRTSAVLPIVLVLFLFMVGLMISGDTSASISSSRPYRVYMITWRGVTDVERGFQSYLAEHKIPVEYIIRDANKEPGKIPGFVEEIRRLKPDLVYTWGTPATLGVVGRFDDEDRKKFINDIPVVFTLVAAPVGAKVVPELDSSKRNVTGVYHVASIDSVLAGIRSYRPFKKVGILYNSAEQNSVAYVRELRKLAAAKGFQVVEKQFRLDGAGKPTTEGVDELLMDLKKQGAEWLLIGPDSYLTSVLEVIAPAVRKARLPAFATTEAVVMAPEGILAGLVSKYYSIGQLTGYKAEQILIGKKPANSIPIETLQRYSFIVRIGVAKELNLYPPVSMFNYAEILP